MLVSNYPNVSINTANPPTEMARSDALRRDLFTPVKEAEKSGAEKPVVTDDKSRSAGNSSSTAGLYDAKGKETETQQAIDGRGERESKQQQEDDTKRDEESASQRDAQQQAEQQEQQKIQEFKSRDQEVKSHEQAHSAIGGRYAGSPSYSYELGPDGKRYAVGGEVQIDVSAIPGDPQATVQKMQQVRAAALSPAEPSSADQRIAAQAAQQQIQAQAELVKQTSGMGKGKPSKEQDESAGSVANTSTQETSKTSSGATSQRRETLAIATQMQLRNGVIASFYQRSTEPLVRQSLQQV